MSRKKGDLNKATIELIELMKQAIDVYSPRTVRGLFYDLVRQNLIPNTQKEYERVMRACQVARKNRDIKWEAIIDPQREPYQVLTFHDLDEFVENVPHWYKLDPWEEQLETPVVWVEKSAQVNPLWQVCQQYRLSLFYGRGYDSWTSLYGLAQTIITKNISEILIFGDHDPSGLDIPKALSNFLEEHKILAPPMTRLGLTIDQIMAGNMPAQKVKDDETNIILSEGKKTKGDSRAPKYKEEFGDECWELDALSPQEIQGLLKDAIIERINQDMFDDVMAEEKKGQNWLRKKLR